MLDKYQYNKNGQIMVEAIVALSMLTMGMIGIFTLLSSSYRFNRISTHEYVASALASEGVEIVRNLVDTNFLSPGGSWNDGLANGDYEIDYNDTFPIAAYSNQFIKLDSSTKIYSYDGGDNTPFRRKISLSNLGSPVDHIKVISQVTWRDKGLDYNVTLEDRLYDWRSAVSP